MRDRRGKAGIALVLGLVVVLSVALSGCSLQLTMSPLVSAADLADRKIPHKVALLMDSAMENYQAQGFSGAEMAKLHYDLGPASRTLFLQAFKLAANEVVQVETLPSATELERNAIAIVVRPRIVGFSEKHSLFLRNADYSAEITYHVTVYDHAGQTLLDQDYSAEGVATGGSDLNRNYEAPVEKAMEKAVVTIIAAISQLRVE